MAKSVSDILADVERQWAKWSSTHRIGVAEYVPNDNTIRLYFREDDYYEVDLERCKDSSQFADWLFHLNDKSWFTGAVMKDFIECFSRAIQERHGVDPRIFLRAREQQNEPEA